MDEYRPFPATQPEEPDDEPDEVVEDAPADDAPELKKRTGVAVSPVMGDTDEEEEEEEAGGRPQRAAPNLDHPGGHLTGTVARLNRPRRFGFLRADDGVEVFFHASALEAGASSFDQLRPNTEVEFDCHQDEQGRGLAATVVRVTGEPPPEPARQPKAPREDRPSRSARAGRDRWRVVVLHDRFDNPASTQLERLLNERNIRPGQFTLAFVEREDGAECWVAYHSGDEPAQKR